MTPLDALITGLGPLLMLSGIFLTFRPGPGGTTVFRAFGLEAGIGLGGQLGFVAVGAGCIALGTWALGREPEPTQRRSRYLAIGAAASNRRQLGAARGEIALGIVPEAYPPPRR